MEKTIKTDVRGMDELTVFWEQYFPETPLCTHPDCDCVAAEVDAFFPYIDDLNRCESHPLPLVNSRITAGVTCGQSRRGTPSRAGTGNRISKIAKITWRPPR